MTNIVVDAHVWIEKKGIIIDPYFPHYDLIAKMWNVSNKRNYVPAPIIIQEHFINEYRKLWNEHFKFIIKKPEPNHCPYNCFLIEDKNSKIVFGSMGFGTGKIHWEFGNPEWKTIQEFTKNSR